MTAHRAVRVLLLVAVIAGPTAAAADAPRLVGYRGLLTDDQGTPVEAAEGLDMTFRLYHDPSGGAAFWTDEYPAVEVSNGVFVVILGAGNNPLPSEQLDGTVKYLGVTIGTGAELAPRMELVSVPYALRADIAGTAIFAEEAGKLGGLAAGDFVKKGDNEDLAAKATALEGAAQTLAAKVADLETTVSVLLAQGGAGCFSECASTGEVGCSADQSARWTCGEAGDGDPCLEQTFTTCSGSLRCVGGQCVCAPAWGRQCIGDAVFSVDSCGKPEQQVEACGPGKCMDGGCFGWTLETPPGVGTIRGAALVADQLYLVGTGGLILHHDGKSWRRMASGTTKDLNAIWGFVGGSGAVLYAVGQGGKVLRMQGGVWSPIQTGYFSTLHAVGGLSSTNVVAAGENGTVLRFDGTKWSIEFWDAGAAWAQTTFRAVWLHSAANFWVGGDGGTVVHFDGSWTQDSVPDGTGTVRGMWGISPNNVWAATDTGILRFQSSWEAQALVDGATVAFKAIFGRNPGGVDLSAVAVGDGGRVYRFDGFTWTRQAKVEELLGTPAFAAVTGSTATGGRVWAIAGTGALVYQDANGAWISPTVPRTVRSIWGLTTGSTSRWAVGSGCLALRYTGSEWVSATVDSPQCGASVALNAVWGDSSGSALIAVGDAGTYLIWTGTGWIDGVPPNTANNYDIWGTGPDAILLVQAASTWLWNGALWQNTGGGGGRAGWGTASNNFYVVDGSTGQVQHFDGSEWTSRPVASGVALADIWGSAADDVWAVGDHGGVFRFDGADWTDMSIPEDTLGAGNGAALTSVWTSALGPAHAVAGGGTTYLYDGTGWHREQTYPGRAHLTVYGIGGGSVLLGGDRTIFHRDP